MRPRWMVAAAGALALGSLAALAPGPRDAAAQPTLPGNVTYDRVVDPLDVAVGDEVGVKVTLDYDNVRTSRGIDVFFVVDRTPTMFDTSISRPTIIDATRSALQWFVNSMDFTKSKAGLMTYAANATVGRNLTDDQDAILQSIRTIRMSEENDVRGLQEAFRTATGKLDNDGTPGNEKVIVIVVAGPDVGNELLNMPTVTNAARNAGVKVVFLMLQIPGKINAAYGHYVDAASDCTWSYCVTWSSSGGGPTRTKYAWGVGVEGGSSIETVVGNLVEHFLFFPTLSEIRVRELYDPDFAELVPSSVVPPPSRAVGPPFYEAEWVFDSLTTGPLTIDFDVKTMRPDASYPATAASQLWLRTSDNATIGPIDLPNPSITVHGAPPTQPATATQEPTATVTTSPTLTPTAVTPLPTATEGPGGDFTIFLPVAMRERA